MHCSIASPLTGAYRIRAFSTARWVLGSAECWPLPRMPSDGGCTCLHVHDLLKLLFLAHLGFRHHYSLSRWSRSLTLDINYVSVRAECGGRWGCLLDVSIKGDARPRPIYCP